MSYDGYLDPVVHLLKRLELSMKKKIFLRLNKEPPNIIFKKKEKGGINLQTMCTQTELDNEMVSRVFFFTIIEESD